MKVPYKKRRGAKYIQHDIKKSETVFFINIDKRVVGRM